MTLTEHLNRLAEIWSQATGRSQARLATIVVNDGKLFHRVAAGAGVTSTTFERFLSFFRDATNWPDGCIPPEAGDCLEGLEAIATAPIAAAGKSENPTAPETKGAPVENVDAEWPVAAADQPRDSLVSGGTEVPHGPFSSTCSTTSGPLSSNKTDASPACFDGPTGTSEAEAA